MFTPLTRRALEPLYPIDCPICGKRLGAFYRDGLSLRQASVACTKRCERLWLYARRKRNWRELPSAWRQAYLAAGLVEKESNVKTPQ